MLKLTFCHTLCMAKRKLNHLDTVNTILILKTIFLFHYRIKTPQI